MGHSTGSGRSSRNSTANAMLRNGELAQDTYGQLAMRNFSDEGIQMAVDRNWIDQNTANRLRGEQSHGRSDESEEFQRDRERQERIIQANNRILGRNMSQEEVSRRATRGAEANAANRRRRNRG